MFKQADYPSIISYHALFWCIVICVLTFTASQLFFPDSPILLSKVLMYVSVLALLQFCSLFVKDTPWVLFSLFALDAALSMLIVKATGGSSSPFLVLFPMISLAGATLFQQRYQIWILMGICVLAMTIGVGFGPSIVGNGLAITGTCVLGFYLNRLLASTGSALSRVSGEKKRLESLQKSIMANMPSGLISINSSGNIIQINDVAYRILGYEKGTLKSVHFSQVLPELDALRSQLEVVTSINDSAVPFTERRTIAFKKDSKEELTLGYSLARLSDPDDKSPIGTLIVLQDLTEVVKLDKELQLSEKLAAIGSLAAGIAHEIRNPLAGISGAAQLLQGIENLGEEDSKLLDIIQKESGRLDHLITEFLEYVRPGDGKKELVDVMEVLDRVSQLLEVNDKWKKLNCQLNVIQSGKKDILVHGDKDKMIQILLNFVLNAGQAGASTVDLGVHDGIWVKIRDDGPGIPLEDQEKIFEPFFTTKESGTGLGLAISYRALEGMSAKIQLESPVSDFSLKKGTLFTIEFKGAA